MKLIVGLGNPGQKYHETRHNLGFVVLDALASVVGASWEKFSADSMVAKLRESGAMLLKPQTFMNASGKSVREVMNFFKVEPTDVWVVHDDLDLEYSRLKLDDGAGAAGHRGVQNIIDELGTKDFKRFRLGIGRPLEPIPAEDYVLQPFTNEEKSKLNSLIEVAAGRIVKALADGWE